MSDSIVVFLSKELLPNVNGVREKLSKRGLELESWDDEGITNIEGVEGFWPGMFKGEEAGFEFFAGPIDDEDLDSWDVDKGTLGARNFCIELSYYEKLDVVAAVLFASYLCNDCGGITFDDEEELTIDSSKCDSWAEKIIEEITAD